MTTDAAPVPRLRLKPPGVLFARLFVIALLLGAGSYVPVTLLAPLQSASAEVIGPPQLTAEASVLAWPGFGASAVGAVGYDGVLASSGTETPLPMASITKIITSLVVLEASPLAAGEAGPAITLSAADAALYTDYVRVNGSVAPALAGWTFSQRQMLEIVLIPSANNYAESMAIWGFGSVPAFVEAARAWLADHGLDDTTIVEPTGLSPANTSTAVDLVALGRLVLADPVLAEIVSTPAVTLPGVGELRNTNRLLGIDGVGGIKTGNLDGIGSNLLFTADYAVGGETVTVIGAVLGAANRDVLYPAVQSLLGTVEAGFREISVSGAGQVFARYSTAWDAESEAVAATDATLLVWSDTPVDSDVSLDELRPARFDEARGPVGSVTFTAGPRTVVVPLELNQTIERPDAWWRLLNPFAADRG